MHVLGKRLRRSLPLSLYFSHEENTVLLLGFFFPVGGRAKVGKTDVSTIPSQKKRPLYFPYERLFSLSLYNKTILQAV